MKDSVPRTHKETLTGRLRELLKEVSPLIDRASEDQKVRLLSLLEDLRRSDRREHPRKPCSTSVTYATLDRIFKAFIRNMGNGGVFIETSEPLLKGQDITVTFSFPNHEEPFKLAGEIAWTVENKGIGVKFTTADHNLAAAVESL
ncbi:MAG: PilZ domain-containing protein [Thermodesulfobacteriota bacterium]|nr:PilZ domain-containing protein [Thermodesulfobacteriota bacterium]